VSFLYNLPLIRSPYFNIIAKINNLNLIGSLSSVKTRLNHFFRKTIYT
jgi:hypothetical protein